MKFYVSYPKGRDLGEKPPKSREEKLKTITDKHRLKTVERVSRNSSEEKTAENFGGDFFNFRTVGTKGRFASFVDRDKGRAKRLERAD